METDETESGNSSHNNGGLMSKRTQPKENKDVFHYFRIALAVVMCVFIGISAYYGYRFGRLIFTDEAKTTLRTEHISYDLTVVKGESVLDIGKDLEDNGVIENAFVFWVQSKVYKCKIAPGTYEVSSRDSSKAILKALNAAYVLSLQGY